jgi:DNA polymerase-3 subunit gamma/tau
MPADFRGFVAMLENSGKRILAQQLHDQVGVVRYAPPELVLKPMKPLGADWPRDLASTLKALTGTSWRVSISDEPSEPSLRDQEAMAEEKARADVLSDINVRAVLDAFPDAQLESYASTKG